MSPELIMSTPMIQYPLRLPPDLHQRFTNVSSKTKIPMSTLGRLSITRFLDDVDQRGITSVLNELENTK